MRIPFHRLRIAIVASLLAFNEFQPSLNAAEPEVTENWLGAKAKRRALTDAAIRVFKANVGHSQLSDKVKEDLKKLGTVRVIAVDLSQPEQTVVSKSIKENDLFRIAEEVGAGGPGKGVVKEFAFGKIGDTRIGMVGFVFSDSVEFEVYLIEKSASQWFICGTGEARIDRFQSGGGKSQGPGTPNK